MKISFITYHNILDFQWHYAILPVGEKLLFHIWRINMKYLSICCIALALLFTSCATTKAEETTSETTVEAALIEEASDATTENGESDTESVEAVTTEESAAL